MFQELKISSCEPYDLEDLTDSVVEAVSSLPDDAYVLELTRNENLPIGSGAPPVVHLHLKIVSPDKKQTKILQEILEKAKEISEQIEIEIIQPG